MEPSYSIAHFHPWVGSEYRSGGVLGLRLLVLGESHHHTTPELADRDMTRIVVENYLAGRARIRFFTSVMQVVTGREYFPYDRRRAFWDSVAFYNFVQE